MQTKSDCINVNPMAENVDVEFPAFKIYFKLTRQNINLKATSQQAKAPTWN